MTKTLRGSISKMHLRAADGALIFVMLVIGVATTQSVEAQTLTVLHNFTNSPDGSFPFANLVRDSTGNAYGTTDDGGTYGYGVVFKVSKSGRETVLHNFTGLTDGGNPFAGLVQDAKGNLYGTTATGGSESCACGVVFKVSKSGKESVLHSFAGSPSDGAAPQGALLLDPSGNLYGTTATGGLSRDGVVFKVSESGKETVLHSFTGGDGAGPYLTSLLMDAKGNLYGIAGGGGAFNAGVLYKLSKNGTLIVLHSFGGTGDGVYPYDTPAMDTKGNFYGTTWMGGPLANGIVWKVSKTGDETVLHTFAGGPSDGAYPEAGVILDAYGNPYGDTYSGGTSNLGTVYKLSKNGTLTLLHQFSGSDGALPFGSLIRDANRNFYGTTAEGGDLNCGGHGLGCGTMWKLAP